MSSVTMSSLIILYLGICFLLSIFSNEVKRYLRIPSFLTLLCWGFLLEELIPPSGLFSEVIDMILESKPNVYQYVFLPILVFTSAYFSNWYKMKMQLVQILILSSSVMLSCSALTALSLEHIFGYNFEFRKLFMFGLVLSSTDNIVFVSVTKDIHISGNIRSLVGGETMLNYATTFLVFEVVLNDYSGTQGLQDGLESFYKLIFGGFAMGLAFSLAHSIILKKILNDFVIETNFTLICAYLLYWVCEYEKVHFSGAFGLVVYGIYISAYGKTRFSPSIESRFKEFVSLLCHNTEAFIMISSGIFLARITLNKSSILTNSDYTNLFLIFLLTYLIRVIVLVVHYPVLRRVGYKIPLKELVFMIFAGMKGVVSIIIASLSAQDLTLTPKERALMSYLGIGVALLCISVGGLVTRFSARLLGLQKLTPAEENVLIGATCALVENTRSQIEKMKSSDEYRLADWMKVSKIVGADDLINKIIQKTEGLKKKYGKTNQDLSSLLNHHNRITMNYQEAVLEIRKRYLSTLKGTYWERFKSGLYSGMSAVILMNSVSHCFEKLEEKMTDWKYIKNNIFSERFMKVVKKYSKMRIIGRVFKKIMYKRIIIMYDSATNFIKGHEITEELFHQFELDYNRKAFKKILKEAHKQVKKCKIFLNSYIFESFPEIISEVQTRQCCKLLLIEQRKIVEEIYAEGLIKELEHEQLLNAVDSSLKTVSFQGTPRLPDLREILRNLFKQATEDEIQDLLAEMVEKTVPAGESLFKEGQSGENTYLIIRGRVREYSSWIDQELVIGNIVGVQHLIEEYSETSTSSASVVSQCVVVAIPKKIFQFPNFLCDVFTEAAEELVMMNRKKYDLLQATDSHIFTVVKQSKVKVLKAGKKVQLLSGALVLNGRLENSQGWVIQPSFEKFLALVDSVLLVFPQDFLFYFEKDEKLGHAFTEYCTRAKDQGLFKEFDWNLSYKRNKPSDSSDSRIENHSEFI